MCLYLSFCAKSVFFRIEIEKAKAWLKIQSRFYNEIFQNAYCIRKKFTLPGTFHWLRKGELNQSELNDLNECEVFVCGFRLGARIMLEVLDGSDKWGEFEE